MKILTPIFGSIALTCLCAGSAQATVSAISGTISTTSAVVPIEGNIVGTFDSGVDELNITVDFFVSTALSGIDFTDTSSITNAISLVIGDPTVAGATALSSGSFTFVNFASSASASGSESIAPGATFTGTPHEVTGTFTLNATEVAALEAGNVFILVDGDDADGVTALTATVIPEPSSALLCSLAGFTFLVRRRRS